MSANFIAWWLLGLTVAVAVAVVLAAAVFVRCGDYVRQARAVIQACMPLVAGPIQYLPSRVTETTQEMEPVPVDEPDPDWPADDADTYGEHALLPTEPGLPVPRYYFDALKSGDRS